MRKESFMMFDVFLPMLVSFVIVLVLGPICIPILRRLKMGNTEREYIKEHKVKNGTPSMGGIMILIAFAVVGFYQARFNSHIYPIVFLTLGFGILGFVDDLLKALKHSSDGLKAWQKMLGQIVLTTGFAVYMVKFSDVSLELRIPYTGAFIDIGWLAIPLLYLAVIGTVNGANFTDGMDGLATSVTLAIAAFFGVAAIQLYSDITPAIAGMIGALFGFLMFNVHPAKIFMGDTGSLALGGVLASVAILTRHEISLAVIGGVFVIETITTLIQIIAIRKFKKRVFKKAPLHHHFEELGWEETDIVKLFWVVGLILAMLMITYGVWL
jgi:phospho-N-acetylmuramoyl-pentapeptide-transferase